eukprot:1531991-Pleurochrysis_carterae.AAC.1
MGCGVFRVSGCGGVAESGRRRDVAGAARAGVRLLGGEESSVLRCVEQELQVADSTQMGATLDGLSRRHSSTEAETWRHGGAGSSRVQVAANEISSEG